MPGKGTPDMARFAAPWAVSSCLINLVIYDENDSYKTVIDRMMWWYAGMKFPTERFDDISAFPKQIQAQAMTPLCPHIRFRKWTMAAGVEVTSKEKYERCAKVAGESSIPWCNYLNEYFDGRWKPAKWTPSNETVHCIECHGPEDTFPKYEDGMNHSRGTWSAFSAIRITQSNSHCPGGAEHDRKSHGSNHCGCIHSATF